MDTLWPAMVAVCLSLLAPRAVAQEAPATSQRSATPSSANKDSATKPSGVSAQTAAVICPPSVQRAARKAHGDKSARQLFRLAQEDFDKNQFQAALSKLCYAYGLGRLPKLLFNIAQVHRNLGDCVTARLAYQAFLDVGSDTAVMDQAKQLLAQLSSCPTRGGKTEQCATATTSTPPKSTERRPKKVVAPDSADSSRVGLAGWLLVGGGVVTGGAAAVLAAIARGHRDEAITGTYKPELEEQADNEDRAASILLGSAVALAGAGALALWLSDAEKDEKVAAGLLVTAEGAAGHLRLQF